MANTGFTKRDLNRFKKVYPFIRRTPRYEIYAAKEGVIIEVAELSFTSSASETYTFASDYNGNTPIVTVANKSSSNNVSLSVTSVNDTQVVIGASSTTFTGTAELHIIYIPS